MDDRAALFANVLHNPADDTARLVLADWLEEHGEDQFGRFLRAGVVASRFRGTEYIDDPSYYAALREIAAVATTGEPARWLSALGVGPSPLTDGDWAWDNAGDRMTVRIGGTVGVFTRGACSPPPPGTTGLYHVAVLYPTKRSLADALRRLLAAGGPLDGASDHGVSEALYLRDPDDNGLELYWDRPPGVWPRTPDGGLCSPGGST